MLPEELNCAKVVYRVLGISAIMVFIAVAFVKGVDEAAACFHLLYLNETF